MVQFNIIICMLVTNYNAIQDLMLRYNLTWVKNHIFVAYNTIRELELWYNFI